LQQQMWNKVTDIQYNKCIKLLYKEV
jgi:hypothetical protein